MTKKAVDTSGSRIKKLDLKTIGTPRDAFLDPSLSERFVTAFIERRRRVLEILRDFDSGKDKERNNG